MLQIATNSDKLLSFAHVIIRQFLGFESNLGKSFQKATNKTCRPRSLNRARRVSISVLLPEPVNGKRLTNTRVRRVGSVVKYTDDRKNRVVSAEATYPCGSSAFGGRICEQRYAAERVLPESRFELQHTGSPPKETALEEKA